MSLKYALLAQLARGPQTGYGLAKSFAGSLNYAWPALRVDLFAPPRPERPQLDLF